MAGHYRVPEWKDQKLREMWGAGVPIKQIAADLDWSQSSVSCRARILDLPRRSPANATNIIDFSKMTLGPKGKVIACLSCGHDFPSEDKANNRVCGDCKGTRMWRSGNDHGFPTGRALRRGAA